MNKMVQELKVEIELIKNPPKRKSGNKKFRDFKKNLRANPHQHNKRDRIENPRH
jgi:hypothetical protein